MVRTKVPRGKKSLEKKPILSMSNRREPKNKSKSFQSIEMIVRVWHPTSQCKTHLTTRHTC